MGYFTETMALFEFKGDAENAYLKRHMYEKQTNSHKGGKSSAKLASNAVSDNLHTYDMNDYGKNNKYSLANSKAPTKERYAAGTERVKNAARVEYDRSAAISKAKQEERRARKSCKESFEEAFASVIL